MKLDRTQNAKRNIVFGFILRVYQLLVPFVIRTAMIHYIGVDYLGLSSLFSSVLQVLNMAELGVGSAMVFSMYKPIAEDDTEKICALMNLYKTYYRVIGLVITIIGLLLVPFLPILIKGEVPADINIYVLYLLNLAATVFSYWGFAYRSSIISAHQRTDLISKINVVTSTVQYAVQIIVLVVFRNYYLYTLVYLGALILNNVTVGIIASKIYPQYKPNGNLDPKSTKAINKRIGDLFTAKLGSVIVNSVDTIVISAFLGLTALAIYQNYYFILTAILGFMSIIFSACTAGIGNSIVVETKEKNLNYLNLFTFIISWIAGFCSTCLLCLYQPFMSVWVGEELKLSFSMVICFSVYFFVYEINQLLNTYKDAAGIWSKDKFRPLITALTNLALNLLMVNYIGLFGILLSTILSMLFVGMPWLLYNLFTELFDRKKLIPYLRSLIRYVVIVVLGCIITYWACSFIALEGFALVVARAVVCCIIPNVWYLLLFFRKTEFKQALRLGNMMTNGMIGRVLKIDFS